MTPELLKQLLIHANELGLEGKRVIDWVPNSDATSRWPGAFVLKKRDKTHYQQPRPTLEGLYTTERTLDELATRCEEKL